MYYLYIHVHIYIYVHIHMHMHNLLGERDEPPSSLFPSVFAGFCGVPVALGCNVDKGQGETVRLMRAEAILLF